MVGTGRIIYLPEVETLPRLLSGIYTNKLSGFEAYTELATAELSPHICGDMEKIL